MEITYFNEDDVRCRSTMGNGIFLFISGATVFGLLTLGCVTSRESDSTAFYLAVSAMAMNALFIVVSGIAMIRRWRDPERRAYAEFLKQEGLKELLEDANEIFVIERVLFNEDDPYGKLPALVYEELDIDLDAVRSDCAARKERLIFTQQMHMRILKIRFGWNPPDQSSKTLTETRELTPGA